MIPDELTLTRDRVAGDRARALLDDPLLADAFAGVERAYMDEWKANALNLGPEGREEIWRAVQLIAKVKAHLEALVRDGELAAAELASLRPDDSDQT
ncbi:hypothetical protein [Bauldia sp.]|uniref:hypothetical protein n=1 Tax=Bauldia sp. TaxID=2575872 RepID=UPI003BAC3779